MDPDSVVVKLCVEGVQAESEGRRDEAGALFLEAWRAASTHVEACYAAHYIARNETDPERALWWHQLALARATAAGRQPGAGGDMRGFYASLHLNLASCHERLGQVELARHHYQRAAAAAATD